MEQTFTFHDAKTGLTLTAGSGIFAATLTFVDPTTGKIYYSLGSGTSFEEVGTNVDFPGVGPDIGATPNGSGVLTITPGGAYEAFQTWLDLPDNSALATAQAARLALYHAERLALYHADATTASPVIAGVSGTLPDPVPAPVGVLSIQSATATITLPNGQVRHTAGNSISAILSELVTWLEKEGHVIVGEFRKL